MKCPTCGSDNHYRRLCVAAYDAPVPFNGVVTLRHDDFTISGGEWVCGYCPDTWHDHERRSGKDRRR